MMELTDFRELLEKAYDRLLMQGRHQLKTVHLKTLYQEMKLLQPKLSLPEFKSHLATLHSKDVLMYEMDRGSSVYKANKIYGIESTNGLRTYLRIRRQKEKTTK